MCGLPGLIGMQVLSGLSQYQQQKQQYNAQMAVYNTQAAAAENNARISQYKQEQIADQYAEKQSKLNDRMRLAAGNAAAEAGASGLQLSGSPVDLLASGYGAYYDDTNTLLQNQRNDIWSERVNEINYANQANSYRAGAENMRRQKKAALWGTILGTAASIYGLNRTYGGIGNTGTQSGTSNMFTNNLFSSTAPNKYAMAYLGKF